MPDDDAPKMQQIPQPDPSSRAAQIDGALKQTVAYFDWLTDLFGGADFEDELGTGPGGKILLEVILNGRAVRALAVEALGPPLEASDVLDRMANPHPRMWAEAKDLFTNRNSGPVPKARWEAALQMMCAATGYEPDHFLEKLAAELETRN